MDPNDAYEYIVASYSFSIRKEKINQIMSVVLRKLAKQDSFSLVLVFCRFNLNIKIYDIIMCLN